MDAQQTQPVNKPLKKTLMLDSQTVEWGEAMAIEDHRGCLSNQIKFLVAQEVARRGMVKAQER